MIRSHPFHGQIDRKQLTKKDESRSESKNSKIVSRGNKGKRNTPDKDDLPNPDTADYDKRLHNLRAFPFSYPTRFTDRD
jgi:hypothetical protein